jgi:hypothetical protein
VLHRSDYCSTVICILFTFWTPCTSGTMQHVFFLQSICFPTCNKRVWTPVTTSAKSSCLGCQGCWKPNFQVLPLLRLYRMYTWSVDYFSIFPVICLPLFWYFEPNLTFHVCLYDNPFLKILEWFLTIASFGLFSRNVIPSILTWHIILQFDGLAVERFFRASFSSGIKFIYFLPRKTITNHFYQIPRGFWN